MNRYNFAESISRAIGTTASTITAASVYGKHRLDKSKAEKQEHLLTKAKADIGEVGLKDEVGGAGGSEAVKFYKEHKFTGATIAELEKKYGRAGAREFTAMHSAMVREGAIEHGGKINAAEAASISRTESLIDPSGASSVQQVQGIQAVNNETLANMERAQLSEQWSQLGGQLKKMKRGGFQTPAEMIRAEQIQSEFQMFEDAFNEAEEDKK